MSCPEELELFLFHDGEELDEEHARDLGEHLATCTACQRALAELLGVGQAFAPSESISSREEEAFMVELVRKIDLEDRASDDAAVPSAVMQRLRAALVACAIVGSILVLFFTFFAVKASDIGTRYAGSAAMDAAVAREAGQSPLAPSSRLVEWVDDTRSTNGSRRLMKVPVEADVGVARDAAAVAGGEWSLRDAYGRAVGRISHGQDGSLVTCYFDRNGECQLVDEAAPVEGPGQVDEGGSPSRWPRAIGPSGRFATTYRPGLGHLAWLERELGLGQVAEAARQLVANVGRGHGPALAPPADRALALDVRAEMTKLPPGGGPVHVAITLRSSTGASAERPPVAVHLVVDTSGSMDGGPLRQARAAAWQLVDLLRPEDRFSLTTCSNDARVVVPEGPVGPRRSEIHGLIDGLEANEGTNLEAGLRQGYGQARRSQRRGDAVQLVIVLSDGFPNVGVTNRWDLSELSAEAFEGGIETTSIGIGDRYAPEVMSALAEYGAGGYYHVNDPAMIEQILRDEVEIRAQPVARAVEVVVRLGDGVELLEAYGSRRLSAAESLRVGATEVAIDVQEATRPGIARDRQAERAGGTRFFIPGFARDDQHTILLRLRAPAGAAGTTVALAEVELRYRDRLSQSNERTELVARVGRAGSEDEALASRDRELFGSVVAFRTGRALLEAARLLSEHDTASALALLWERAQALRSTSSQIGDEALLADADRLDAFTRAVADQETPDPLSTSWVLEQAGAGFMR
jgi:Ca-activated chloride channel family protein